MNNLSIPSTRSSQNSFAEYDFRLAMTSPNAHTPLNRRAANEYVNQQKALIDANEQFDYSLSFIR